MATVWSIIAFWILPIPLTLFALISLPTPRSVKRGVLIFTQRVFEVPLIGTFKLLHVMLWLCAVAFLGSARQVQVVKQAGKDAVWPTPNMEISHLSKRWRAERNLWMTAFAFCAWVSLAALYREVSRRLALEARLLEMERSEMTAVTEAREPSVGREVTSKAAAGAGNAATPAPRDRAAGAASPNKTASAPAAEPVLGFEPGAGTGEAGIQMQELKKTA